MSKILNISIAVMLLAGTNVLADWEPGDPHKMHFPQLPNPMGCDVSFKDGLGNDAELADGRHLRPGEGKEPPGGGQTGHEHRQTGVTQGVGDGLFAVDTQVELLEKYH